MRPLLVGALVLALLALACGSSHEFNGRVVDPLEAAPEIGGTNWDGRAFRNAEVAGRVGIVFFGYASCPDVCPLTLSKLRRLRNELGERGDALAVVLVSVDPERDTLEVLSEYVPSFDPDFYGVRLEPEALAEVAGRYYVTYAKRPMEGEGMEDLYAMDHTGTLFVIDGAGRLRLRISQSAAVDEILPDIAYLIDEARG